jgi:hypothetical protein
MAAQGQRSRWLNLGALAFTSGKGRTGKLTILLILYIILKRYFKSWLAFKQAATFNALAGSFGFIAKYAFIIKYLPLLIQIKPLLSLTFRLLSYNLTSFTDSKGHSSFVP